MDEKVDQDVREAAVGLEDFVYIGGARWADAVIAGRADHDKIVQAFARMKAAGREAGLREAAAKCLEVSGLIGAGHGSSIDSALREAFTAIEALLSEKPA